MADDLGSPEVSMEGRGAQTENPCLAETTKDRSSQGPAEDTEEATAAILQQALEEVTGGQVPHLEDQDVEEHIKAQSQESNHSPRQTHNKSNGNATLNSTNPSDGTQNKSTVQAEKRVVNKLTAGNNSTLKLETLIKPSPPLGSKTNPIRIIQQGNTYSSTQQLSKDQIQQIVQVLQRQNVAAKSAGGASTAVFNPATNTRIVYRVVQPHANQKASKPDSSTTNSGNIKPGTSGDSTYSVRDYHRAKYGSLTARKGKARKRPREKSEDESSESDDEAVEVEDDSGSDEGDMANLRRKELSPSERLKKKREKPITRSGRVSKPPSHMVKDYKQIHRVDWYEDYDDSDGGYSDIYDSGDEAKAATPAKSKNKFPCAQCDKSYIGAKSLARHYKATGHGDPAELISEEEEDKVPVKVIGDNSTPSPSGISFIPGVKGGVRRRGRKKKEDGGAWTPRASAAGAGQVGRPPVSELQKKIKRQQKLSAIMSTYSCAELLKAIGPHLAKHNVSLYDVMKGGLAARQYEQASYTRMLQLYTALQVKMTDLAVHCLRPITQGEQVAEDKEAIQIATATIANSIGVSPGYFEVSDIPTRKKPDEKEIAKLVTDTPEPLPAQSCLPETQSPTKENQVESGSDVVQSQASAPGSTSQSTDATNSLSNTVKSGDSLIDSGQTADQLSEVKYGYGLNDPSTMSKTSEAILYSEPMETSMNVGDVAESVASLAETVSQIRPGDVIQVDGQNIVIPEGANIVQTQDGIVVYQSTEPGAASILTVKLGPDPPS